MDLNQKIKNCSDTYLYGSDTIALPVVLDGLPEQIIVEGSKVSAKTTFHISLVCVGKIIAEHKITTADFEEKVVDDFCEFIKKNDVVLKQYRNEFRFVEEGERRAVVVMCDVSNIESFFDVIREKYNLKLEYQPTHVTLYTLQPDAGIFLSNASDVDKLSRILEVPDEVKTSLDLK